MQPKSHCQYFENSLKTDLDLKALDEHVFLFLSCQSRFCVISIQYDSNHVTVLRKFQRNGFIRSSYFVFRKGIVVVKCIESKI